MNQKKNILRSSLLTLGLAILLCVSASSTFGQTHTDHLQYKGNTLSIEYTGSFSLSAQRGKAGAVVRTQGSGFGEKNHLEILWQSFRGSWKVENGEFHGRNYTEELVLLTEVWTDATGEFNTEFTIPEGFGFLHDVLVVHKNKILNKAAFEVEMEVSVSPSSGPVGTPISVDIQGIGWRPLENSWVLLYDNKFTGWMSAVSTNGSARAIIPATGTPGKHILRILHGAFTFPYMNMQQSPQPDRPTFTFEFEVTAGTPVLPPPAEDQGPLPTPAAYPIDSKETLIWTEVSSGPVGTPIKLNGERFPANTQIKLRWYRVTGSRVSGQGWTEESSLIGAPETDGKGSFQFSFPALDDLGGAHRIEADAGDKMLAKTEFTITPSAFNLQPTMGPAGTIATIHLKGVGWTETANIYTVVYDNAYVGYACGFNSQGDVIIYLPMAGTPGWHFIDLYPGIYKGKDVKGVNNFRIPQLTFLEDHPGEQLPAFRFAFKILDESS